MLKENEEPENELTYLLTTSIFIIFVWHQKVFLALQRCAQRMWGELLWHYFIRPLCINISPIRNKVHPLTNSQSKWAQSKRAVGEEMSCMAAISAVVKDYHSSYRKAFFASCRLLPCDILCLANSPSSCVLFPLGVGEGWPKESGGSESEGNHKDTWEGRDPATQRWRKQTWSIGCSWHNYFSYSLVSFQAEEVVGHGQCYLQTEVALVKNSLSMWGKDLQHSSHKLTESYLYLWPITASLHSTSLIPCASWKDRMPME